MSAVTNTVRNGVDTEQMFATLDLIKAQPELARFQFRASNRWIDGAHNRSTIQGFYAAGGEDTTRTEAFEVDAGEPAILLGADTGANPAEYLLHALAACLTTTIVYVAAARKVQLTSVESTLTGDMDVRGALGVDDVGVHLREALRDVPGGLLQLGQQAGELGPVRAQPARDQADAGATAPLRREEVGEALTRGDGHQAPHPACAPPTRSAAIRWAYPDAA